jgi:membrane-bound ClpP family serine protease
MDILIVIVLCVIGIVLILVEIFLIPGVTFTAIAGAAFSIGGVYYAFRHLGTTAGVISLVLVAAIIGIAFVYLVKSKALDRIALKTDIDSTVAAKELTGISEGDTGVTISRLNPVGKVRVNSITMEAKTLSGFIDENTAITVIKVSPTQLTVTNINN